MKVYTLFSGSSGNCVYIESANAKIVIDVGKAYTHFARGLDAIGTTPDALDCAFVTHGHSDHTAGLSQLMKRTGTPVHMTSETAADVRMHCPFSVDTIVTHPREFEVNVGDITVESFRTSHDSAGSVGYIVTSRDEKIGIATDLGYVSRGIFDKLSKCTRVVIESNYDEDMLKTGPYSFFLKQRIASNVGHLSNSDCARVVAALAQAGVGSFLLAHLSENNNTPEYALAASCAALSEIGRTDVVIAAADRNDPTFFG